VKWDQLDLASLLLLLRPVASHWNKLGELLLKDDLQYKIKSIENESFYKDDSKKALSRVLMDWREQTKKHMRTWQTLCDFAKKHGDDTLESYVEKNALESELNGMVVVMHSYQATYFMLV